MPQHGGERVLQQASGSVQPSGRVRLNLSGVQVSIEGRVYQTQLAPMLVAL